MTIKRDSMKKRIWLVVPAILLTFAIIAVALQFKRDPMEEVRREVRAAGLPTTPAELRALGPQTGSDAGPFYKQHQALVDRYVAKPGNSHVFGDLYEGGLSDAERDKIVLKMRSLIGPTLEGAKCDRWVMVVANGEHVRDGLSGLDLLCFIAEADARGGKFDLAIDELRSADRILVQVEQNPSLSLVWSGLYREEDKLMASFHRCMESVKGDAAGLEKGERFLKSLPSQPRVNFALKCDSAEPAMDGWISSTMDIWRESDEDPTQLDQIKDKFWYGPKIRRERARYSRLLLRIYKDLPPDVDWKTANLIHDRDWEEEEKRNGAFVYFNFKTNEDFMLKMWPSDMTRRRVELAAIRIQLLRLKTGTLPKRLPDFGPDGVDPFTGKPLLYKLRGSGFVVYGVGRKGVDDGGMALHGADIVAEFQ
jgi:hypothetical protein